MVFWLILAAMTLGALAFVLWPFVFVKTSAATGGDMAVYRDQLQEIERDRSAGLIDESESEAARIEVSRRLLKAAETPDAAAPGARSSRLGRIAALAAAVIVVPALSAGLYYRLGAPREAEPRPVASARKPGTGSIEEMVAQIETHLQRQPDDARAYEVLGPVYMRLGRYADAANAWSNVVRLKGESAEALENLGESTVAAADGVVTEEAKRAFDRALALDKNAIAARYYRGLAAVQDGRNEDARKIWSDLLASAPPDASWAASVRQSLARLDGKAPPAQSAAGQAGPTQQQMQDAANLPPDEQDKMVLGMVEKLAARLKLKGDDPQGWAQLVRSYGVLGDRGRAQQAEADARKALASSPPKLAMFEEAVKEMDQGGGAAASAPAAPAAPADENGQLAMIRQMVRKLADQLKQNGDDPQGWARLVKSYDVLGDRAAAGQAADDARKALAASPVKRAMFEDELKDIEQANAAQPAAAAPAPAPPAANAGAQGDMIQQMVQRLADRLKQNGDDPDGWLRLVKSYNVLGDSSRAQQAVTDARSALAADADGLKKFNEGLSAASN
ncbi:MAG: c-type cytochrome biogenesis protein CcmI [Hyphomicrobiales bacterium]|nr:c-type cytochrome biogenesis protein CcmI [Hyphomicrobiales bacterium]